MLNFKNDYSEGACSEVLEALVKTNYEQTVGYGEDEYCEEARNLIKENINYSNKVNTCFVLLCLYSVTLITKNF